MESLAIKGGKIITPKGIVRAGLPGIEPMLPVLMSEGVNKGRLTPYEGMTLAGWPTITIVRGEVVVEDGEITGKSGFGKFVPMHMEV